MSEKDWRIAITGFLIGYVFSTIITAIVAR